MRHLFIYIQYMVLSSFKVSMFFFYNKMLKQLFFVHITILKHLATCLQIIQQKGMSICTNIALFLTMFLGHLLEN